MRTATAGLVLASLLALGTPAAVSAQEMHGVVLYNHNELPVQAATVRLLDAEARLVAATSTGVDGRFRLPIPVEGEFLIHVEHVTAFDMVDGPVTLGNLGTSLVTFHVVPKPIALEAIEVEVEGAIPQLARVGFYEREDHELGYFLDPEEIDRRNPFRASDLIRMTPGMTFLEVNGVVGGVEFPVTNQALRDQRFGGGALCWPRVYVDGILVEFGGRRAPFSRFDDLLAAHDIAAMEVYNSQVDVPVQFGGLGACGLVMLWSKFGLKTR